MSHTLNKAPDSRITIDGQEFLYFGGTSYLGLQTNSAFQEIFISNIKSLGTNWGASRKSNVGLSVFSEFENYISDKMGSQNTLVVSSGYLAGQMLARYFIEFGYDLFCAPNTHPALLLESTKIFKTYDDLEKALIKQAASENLKKVVLFMDTIDFSGGNYPEFEALKKLPLEDVILVADDSHGFGIIGENGFESYTMLRQLKTQELIVCGSLGKALATPCGIIAGGRDRLNDLRDLPFYAGGSPPSPAALNTLMNSEDLCYIQRQSLQDNISTFTETVPDGFENISMKHHPVFSYNNERLTAYLYEENILTTNFRYPTKTSPVISKIVLSAHHSKEDILKLTDTMHSFYKK